MTSFRLVRINCPDRQVAETIATALIEARLAACVNITEPVVSIYRWDGDVQRDTEWVLLAKSTAERFAAICEKVTALHPHKVPAILALPVDASDAFGAWISGEVGD